MSVSLQKGQKVSLTKDNAGLGTVVAGLGWDEVKKKGGFLGGLLGGPEGAAARLRSTAMPPRCCSKTES